ncbi:MAG: hypothetical protein IT260_13225 [Saprospiraceae bacterium]|nr:hypothetical protein [Saprospiraceae bacterium]
MVVKTSLFELILALDTEEQKKFASFLASPYFNKGKSAPELSQLFQILVKYKIKEEGNSLDKDAMFRALFPGMPLVAGKVDKLLVELNRLIRSFLMAQRYFRPENEFQQHLDLGAALLEKGFEDRYRQLLANLQALQQDSPWRNEDFFEKQFRLEFATYEYESLYNKQKDDLNISNVIHNLDLYYHLHRLERLNHFLLQRKVANLATSDGIEFALNHYFLPEQYLQESSELLITYKIFLLLQKTDPTVEDFQELEGILKENEHRISKGKLEQFYVFLRNTCVLLINSGSEDLWGTLHRLQQDNLARGYLYLSGHQGQLSPSTVLNLVNVGLYVQNYDWVRAFLETHKERIQGDNESLDFYRLNSACHLFASGQYRQALDHIPAASGFVDYHLMARRLEIKCYYELKDDLLQYKLDAFRMYISRTSQKFLSGILRSQNADFINLLVQILQSAPGDKDRFQRLQARISGKKGVAERRWLLEKVAEEL